MPQYPHSRHCRCSRRHCRGLLGSAATLGHVLVPFGLPFDMCPGTPVADDEVGLSMTIIGSDQRSCRRPTCCTLSLPLATGIVGSPHTPRLDPRRTHSTRAVGTGIPDGLISWGLESHTRGHAFGTPSLGTERRHVPDPALPSLECTALDDLQPTLCMICMSERSKSSYHLRSVIMLANTQQSAAALRITLCESVRFFLHIVLRSATTRT